jgi:flagellar M-ring protein FliF
MEKVLQQILAFWKALSLRQRMVLGGSVVLVGGTIWLFTYWMGSDYKTLYSGMAPADAQNIAQKLAAQNIVYQISPDGTSVLVKSDQLDKARLEVASQGPINSGRMGFELFDKPNWSGSDFSEKVNYQRALEAELERTIGTMSGVETVRVHLVLPRESLFTDREHPAKAAVVLKLRGMRLNDQVAGSVANLVSSAWEDLSPQNVTVVTTDGQMPNAGHSHGLGAVTTNEDLETALAEKVVQTLTPLVGAEHVKSSVTIDYDLTSGETTQETYDPNQTAVLTSQLSQETVGDLEPAGIPGTPSNTPNSQGASAAAQQAKTATTTQGIRSESKTFAVSKVTKRMLEPAGRIRRVAAAVLVDDAVETKTDAGKAQETRRKRTPDEMKQMESLVRAAIGIDDKRGDQLSVENVAFTMPATDVPAPATKMQRVMQFAERWTGVLRYVALSLLFVLVYVLLLRPVKNQVIQILKNPSSGGLMPVASGPDGAELPAGAAVPLMESGNPADAAAASNARVMTTLKNQLVTKVKADPETASRLIQNWLKQSEAHK